MGGGSNGRGFHEEGAELISRGIPTPRILRRRGDYTDGENAKLARSAAPSPSSARFVS
jgi:hypothetical protein